MAIRHPVIRRYKARQGYGEPAGSARRGIKKRALTAGGEQRGKLVGPVLEQAVN